MNVNKQIEYWSMTAVQDIETANILFDNKKFRESLFFCHLTIEKILKANYVKHNNDFAPKSHNLMWLANKSNICIDNKYDNLIGLLMTYQLEGRYPDYYPKLPEQFEIRNFINQTEELLQWLKSLL
ncbi:hypothetical protein MASR1M45_02710 [Candidatus Kapaibacterium sp.]